MKYSLFDIVELIEEIPENNLVVGMLGAVVDVYTEPTEAYEVEFCDPQGKTFTLCVLFPHQLRCINIKT